MTDRTANPERPPKIAAAQTPGLGLRRRLSTVVVVALTAGVVYALVSYVGGRAVLDALSTFDSAHWLAALLLVLVLPLPQALRLRVVLNSLGVSLSWKRAYSVVMGIYPFNVFAPARAGDLLRVVSLRRDAPPMLVAGGLLFERLLDVASLSLFAAIGGIYLERFDIVAVAAAGLAGVMAAFLLARSADRLPVGGRLGERLGELAVAVEGLTAHPRGMTAALVISFVHWQLAMLLVAILFDGVGVEVPFGFIATAMPVALFVGLLPVTLGGMGTRDAALVFLFAGYADSSQTLAVGLLYSLLTYWVLGILGLPFARRALGD